MNASSLLKKALPLAAATAAVTCLLALSACSSNGLTGGTAATVNGAEISEDTVTTYIQNFRKTDQLTDDASWASWLSENGLDAAGVRDEVIDYYVDIELEKQAAEENGITVDDSEVDAAVSSMKANYDGDDAWNSALSSAGMTEDEYRDNVRNSMLQSKLSETVVDPNASVSDDQVLSMVAQYAPAYSGMKRSSHILFATGDEATAQSVLDQINAGTLDFAEAAKQYSTDTGSAANGGDVGWDQLSSFVTAYTDGLAPLAVGQVSGLVTSDYGIHVIKCTDQFNAPETITSLDQVPTELVDTVRSYLSSQNSSTQFSTWFEDYTAKADIQKNDMPSKVPYNVDISKYVTSSTEEDSSASEGSADGLSVTTEEDASASESAAVEATTTSSSAQ